MVRMRAPERSSRVDRRRRAKAFSFTLRPGRSAARGSRSTPKFFGRARRNAAMAASAKTFAGLRRSQRLALGFAPGSVGVAAIGQRTGGVESAAVTAGVELSAVNPSDSRVRPIESILGWASANSPTVAIWLNASGCRESFELRERLYPVRPGEMRVFGPQEIDRVLLLVDEVARLHQLLGGVDCLVLDAVDVGGRSDQRGDRKPVHETPHQIDLPRRAGNRASASIASSIRCAGAPVRRP